MEISLKTDLVFGLIFEPVYKSATTINLIILELTYKLNEQVLSKK